MGTVSEQEKTAVSHESSSVSEERENNAHERHEAPHETLEKARVDEHDQHDALEKATKLAEKADKKNKEMPVSSPAERRRGPISKKQLDTSFTSQMNHAQAEMSTSHRLLSKVIHNKPIEKTSEFIGSTLARPNAMLFGSIFAFVGITILYFVSKYYGFQLSGFETIATFIAGWIIGIVYDYFSVMIRGHKH